MNNLERLLKNKIWYEGSVWKTNRHGECVLISYKGANNVTVKFKNTGTEVKAAIHNLKRGEVRDRLQPTYRGVGIIGTNCVKGRKTYQLWHAMLDRCYGEDSSYTDCVVSENFKYYPYFDDWCTRQKGYGCVDNDGRPFQLDKDILGCERKMYNENHCVFIPHEINSFVSNLQSKGSVKNLGVTFDKKNGKFVAQLSYDGEYLFLGRFDNELQAFMVYKEEKQKVAKKLAEKWYGMVDNRVVEVLLGLEINYEF